MFNDKRFLALIPARGGSIRLPRKNIMDLMGKPLIAWTIQAAINSKYIDEVIVSTDDEEIAQVSKNFGAKIPFIRPDYLSTDGAITIDVLKHAILYYNSINQKFDYIILLQPTSPLRTSDDIDNAIIFLDKKKADAIISICKSEHSPLWMNIIPDDLSMGGFISNEIKNKRSQDFPIYYRLNGAIYIFKIERLLKENTLFFEENIFAYIMKKETSIDIDDQLDFNFAEFFISKMNKS